MSTKKRLLIISACYVVAFMIFVIILAFSTNGWLDDIQIGLQFAYSLYFTAIAITMGITTRLLSVKPSALILSMLLLMASICGSLLTFNIAYPADEIEQINGMNDKLSIFDDIGPDYMLYIIGVLLVSYIITVICVKIKQWFKSRSVVKNLALVERKQTKVDAPMYLKSYNKVTNRYEKYLIWYNPKGKLMSSDKIIYFDSVELIMVDSKRNIYAMLERPEKITMKQYLLMLEESKNLG